MSSIVKNYFGRIVEKIINMSLGRWRVYLIHDIILYFLNFLDFLAIASLKSFARILI